MDGAEILRAALAVVLTPESFQWISGLSSLAAGDVRGVGGGVVGVGVVRLLAIAVRVRRRRHDLPELL